jgi:hypothetical protein
MYDQFDPFDKEAGMFNDFWNPSKEDDEGIYYNKENENANLKRRKALRNFSVERSQKGKFIFKRLIYSGIGFVAFYVIVSNRENIVTTTRILKGLESFFL